jgi:hypothetical protein
MVVDPFRVDLCRMFGIVSPDVVKKRLITAILRVAFPLPEEAKAIR